MVNPGTSVFFYNAGNANGVDECNLNKLAMVFLKGKLNE
jgi:hypothetical protein